MLAAPSSAQTVPALRLPAQLSTWASQIWLGGVWAGDGAAGAACRPGVVPSGQAALNAQLPGGGWPLGTLTEVLVDEFASCEWRLLAPALRQVAAAGRAVVLIAPPHLPHGLVDDLMGLARPGGVLRVRAGRLSQALWACEQVIKSGVAGAVVAWLPRVKPAALRRLQAQAQAQSQAQAQTQSVAPAGGGLLFVVRPTAAQHESSPAPLRVIVRPQVMAAPVSAGCGITTQTAQTAQTTRFDKAEAGRLSVQILKRRGPPHEGGLSLTAWPPGLAQAVVGKVVGKTKAAATGKGSPQVMGKTASQPQPASSSEISHAALAGTAP